MTTDSWMRPSHRGVRSPYDDDYKLDYAADDYDLSYRKKYDSYSPTTKRKMISKLEHRLSELRESSESMALKLGRAEKALRTLKLEDQHKTTALNDDTYSDDSLLYDDGKRHHHRYHGDRDALRREIARLREDLRLLQQQTTTTNSQYVTDDNITGHNNLYDDYYSSSSRYRRHTSGYGTAADDDLLRLSRSRTTFDDVNYERYRVDAPFNVPSTHCGGVGLRTSFARPITTQHNRMTNPLGSPTYSRRWTDGFDTTAMRTFKPYGPRDLTIGDVVKFRRSAGRMERGRVLYIGHLPGKSEAFIGVELETNTGCHDGLHNGFRYFQCKPNRGLFIPFDNVVVAWGNRVC